MSSRSDLKPLRIEEVRGGLGASIFGRNIVWSERTESTHTVCKRLAAQGAPEGTLVITEEQTAGRGRMERRWMSPPCANLLFSVLLRPCLKVDEVFLLTMTLALAVVDGIEAATGVFSSIKWPNDLYVRTRKLGGILTEFWASEKDVDAVVIGLGLNVNWSPGQEDGLSYPATSLLLESGRAVSREELLAHILPAYESGYRRVLDGDGRTVCRRWNDRSMLLGKTVEVVSGGPSVAGRAVRIEPDGALIVRDEGGDERRILYGDVSVREVSETESGA